MEHGNTPDINLSVDSVSTRCRIMTGRHSLYSDLVQKETHGEFIAICDTIDQVNCWERSLRREHLLEVD